MLDFTLSGSGNTVSIDPANVAMVEERAVSDLKRKSACSSPETRKTVAIIQFTSGAYIEVDDPHRGTNNSVKNLIESAKKGSQLR
jgi:hypothetical protein